MQKKNYKAPEAEAVMLRMESLLCQSVDVNDNNSISIGDVTETGISVDWIF